MTGHTLNRARPFYGTQPAAVNKCTNRKSNMAKDTLKENFYPCLSRPGFFLSCGSSATKAQRNSRRWETTRRRVSHQGLVASALLRVARFLLGEEQEHRAASNLSRSLRNNWCRTELSGLDRP